MGIDVTLVNVIDEVGRRGIDCGRKVGHEGRQQAGDQEAQQSDGDVSAQHHRQHPLKIQISAHAVQLGTQKGRCQHGQADDEEVAGRGEHDVDPGAHHRGFAGILAGEHALHIVVGSRSGGRNQQALEEQHHHEEAEELILVCRDLGRGRGQKGRPVQAEVPAEEEIVPAGGHHFVQGIGGHLHHGDDAHGKTGDGQNEELNNFCNDDADHAALDHIDRRDGDQNQRILVRREMEGQELRGKLADALEAVCKEADDADKGVEHNNDVRKLRAQAGAEAGLDPLRAGHHLGAAQPRGEIDHQEDLVEGRPEPWNPHALQAVDEHPVHQQHGAADVEHARCIGDAQQIPGHLVAAQEVVLHTLRGAF